MLTKTLRVIQPKSPSSIMSTSPSSFLNRKSEWHGKRGKQVAVGTEKLRERAVREGGGGGTRGSSSVSSREIVDEKLVDERSSLFVALHGGLA